MTADQFHAPWIRLLGYERGCICHISKGANYVATYSKMTEWKYITVIFKRLQTFFDFTKCVWPALSGDICPELAALVSTSWVLVRSSPGLLHMSWISRPGCSRHGCWWDRAQAYYICPELAGLGVHVTGVGEIEPRLITYVLNWSVWVFTSWVLVRSSPGLLHMSWISRPGCSRYECWWDRAHPAGRKRWPNVDPMLVHRLRRWTNIRSALGQCVVPAGWAYDIPANSIRWINVDLMLVRRLQHWSAT